MFTDSPRPRALAGGQRHRAARLGVANAALEQRGASPFPGSRPRPGARKRSMRSPPRAGRSPATPTGTHTLRAPTNSRARWRAAAAAVDYYASRGAGLPRAPARRALPPRRDERPARRVGRQRATDGTRSIRCPTTTPTPRPTPRPRVHVNAVATRILPPTTLFRVRDSRPTRRRRAAALTRIATSTAGGP